MFQRKDDGVGAGSARLANDDGVVFPGPRRRLTSESIRQEIAAGIRNAVITARAAAPDDAGAPVGRVGGTGSGRGERQAVAAAVRRSRPRAFVVVSDGGDGGT